jgi:Actinobacteria/chloroflexi VLRF1 release factor
VSGRPVAGGGRRVEVGPERLVRWINGFTVRHGAWTAGGVDGSLVLTAADGAVAEFALPPGGSGPAEDVEGFVAAASASRRLGLLLVRRGGIAVGVADGPELTASKVDSKYVQSRTAAGGWSQQRFARRRENQAKALAGGAADVAVRLLAGERLDALVTGGDRALVDVVLADPRLAGLPASARHLDVPDPRLAVLKAAVPAARAVHITLRDP